MEDIESKTYKRKDDTSSQSSISSKIIKSNGSDEDEKSNHSGSS